MRQSLTTIVGKTKRKTSLSFTADDVEERSRRIEERYISTTPYKILDAPGVLNDYYLNILDWSGDIVAIALKDAVYTYNVETKAVNELHEIENGYISSVKIDENDVYIGESTGSIKVYNLEKEECVVNYKQIHNTRVGSISINRNIITSGEKEGLIINSDKRINKEAGRFEGHKHEVCGLKWSPNREYLASGSNDNSVKIWKMGSPMGKSLNGHSSAVKALDWCKWKSNILCTGGGSKDKTLRVWDAMGGKEIKKINTDSQICSLHYLTKYKELVTSHGFLQNDLKLWRASGGIKLIKSFGMHDSRVLNTVLSPDETNLVSLGADESLKFWKLDEYDKPQIKRSSLNIR